MRIALIAIALAAANCGGEYVQSGRAGGHLDRGEVNGRTFDFVSNKPDGDDWTIRIRGTSMFVSYANADQADKLGQIALTDKEGRKVWRLVDKLELPSRRHGKKSPDEGYVTLVLREPPAGGARDATGRDDGDGDGDDRDVDPHHTITTVYVPRDNDLDDDLVNLAAYLVDLVKKYKHESPHF